MNDKTDSKTSDSETDDATILKMEKHNSNRSKKKPPPINLNQDQEDNKINYIIKKKDDFGGFRVTPEDLDKYNMQKNEGSDVSVAYNPKDDIEFTAIPLSTYVKAGIMDLVALALLVTVVILLLKDMWYYSIITGILMQFMGIPGVYFTILQYKIANSKDLLEREELTKQLPL